MDRIKALWEASHVRRFHTRTTLQHYDVGQHTYRMLMLAHLLCPRPTVRLLRAITFHDSAERWTGDVPATAKWRYVSLEDAMDEVERKVNRQLQILATDLTPDEKCWLKALDALELLLFCKDELALGNTTLGEPHNALLNFLCNDNDWVPRPVRDYLKTLRWEQQGDML